jgi:hypothetical protein
LTSFCGKRKNLAAFEKLKKFAKTKFAQFRQNTRNSTTFKNFAFSRKGKKHCHFNPSCKFLPELAMFAHLHCIHEKKELRFPVQLLAFRFSFELSNCVVA